LFELDLLIDELFALDRAVRTSGLDVKRNRLRHASHPSSEIGSVVMMLPISPPTHPGIAAENRPAVEPATTIVMLSGDGNFGTIASGPCSLANLRARPEVSSPSSSRVSSRAGRRMFSNRN